LTAGARRRVVDEALARGYVTAAEVEEAARRQQELAARGRPADLLAVLVGGYLRPEHARALGLGPARADDAATVPPPPATARADAAATVPPPGGAATVAPSPDGRPTRPRATAGAPTGEGAPDAQEHAVALVRRLLARDPSLAVHADVVLERREELGRGGMGVVYRVHDRRLGREAALKLLHAGADAAARRRFFREARITARLDHPTIPPVHEAGVTPQGEPYLLMKRIRGRPLSEAIRAADASRRELLEAVAKVAEGVADAHARQVVHRDLKPANVMLGRFGEVLVLDWGLAKDLSGQEDEAPLDADAGASISREDAAELGLTQAGAIMGTPGYCPPEQCEDGTRAGPPVDVFALGAILVEVLTGRPPVTGKTALNKVFATVKGRIARPRDRRRDAPPALDAIAARALAVEPADRYPTAEAFLADLRAYLADEPVAAYPEPLRERALRAARRRPALLAGVASALLLTLLAGLGAALWRDRAQADRVARARAAARAAAAKAEAEAASWTTRRLAALQAALRWHALAPDRRPEPGAGARPDRRSQLERPRPLLGRARTLGRGARGLRACRRARARRRRRLAEPEQRPAGSGRPGGGARGPRPGDRARSDPGRGLERSRRPPTATRRRGGRRRGLRTRDRARADTRRGLATSRQRAGPTRRRRGRLRGPRPRDRAGAG